MRGLYCTVVNGSAPPTPEAIEAAFRERGFVTTGEVATTLYLSEALGKPVLLEGPAGVGKTEIGKLWADIHGAELVRLQCYEGLDEAKALYEWSYGKQMLYAQLLREKTAELLADAPDLGSAVRSLRGQADLFFSEEFLLARPLLRAIRGGRGVVLLVDEIDRADVEFEAFLLEVLSDRQVSIPEIGTLVAPSPPRVVLTSNDTRELSDALRRRCLYLFVDYPSHDEELEIVARRVPDVPERLRGQLVAFVQSVRKSALRKQPGIAETVDWALALVAVGASSLGPDVVRRTLGALLKNREDVERVLSELSRHRA
jgi:MoxR-like ATPase